MALAADTALSRTDRLVAAAFFVAVFFFFLHPVREGDVWWHLSQGRFIVETLDLPDSDPLLYTANNPPTPMEEQMMKNYWLADSLYYLIVKAAGFGGLALLNATIFTAMFAAVWLTVRLGGLGSPTALLLLFPAMYEMQRFDEVRPHALSFLFVAVTIYLLESARLRRESAPARAVFSMSPVVALVPVMALWSNCHQGYTIGIGVIAIYMVSSAGEVFFRDTSASGRGGLVHLSLTGALAVIATLANPRGYRTAWESIVNVLRLPEYSSTIIEVKSLRAFAAQTGHKDILLVSVALTLGLAILLGVRWRRLVPAHAALAVGMAFAAWSAIRFLPFFLLTATAIGGFSLSDIRFPRAARLRPLGYLLVALLTIWFSVVSYRNLTSGAWPIMTNWVPTRAVSFMKEYGVPREVFNAEMWGGYAEWELGDTYRFFIDTRFSNTEAQRLYEQTMQGNKEEVFKKFGINTVLFYPVFDRKVQPLVLALQRDPAWRLVYADPEAVIYVREDVAGDLPTIDKELLWRHLVAFGTNEIRLNPESPAGYDILGTVAFYRGEWDKASRYLAQAEALRQQK
jgi:hypothetical protein